MSVSERRRRVLITGGTGSVGAALVEGFANADYDVTFQYSKNKRSAKALQKKWSAKALHLDFSKRFTLPQKNFDVVINNAAVNESDVQTHEVTSELWALSIQINLTAPYVIIKECLPHMIRRRWGRIINISSIYGLRGVQNRLPYTVSKHGLSGLTKTVAKEYADRGVTSNEICPGPIESSMMNRIARHAVKKEGGTLKRYFDEVHNEIPANRMAKALDVVSVAMFLASRDSGYITGTSIAVDGGMIA